jgi:ketosteroid isomerase-like protein
MKKLIAITILTAISAISAFAQTSGEKEILKFIADYDQSYINKDISFVENNLADDYTVSNPDGSIKNRIQTLEDIRKDIANPTEKMLSFKSVNDSVRVVGNVAVASGTWMWSGVSMNDSQSEPHNDKGRYTMVLEKRGGKWMLVSEHYSEAQHDRKAMEAQVLKVGLAYNEMIVRGNASEIEKILADEYLYTNEKGEVRNKTEDLATYKTRKSKIESSVTTNQKVRVIGNNAAIETGTFHVKGIGGDGKPFDETERYTSVWMWRDLRWQLVSDHTSQIN